MPLSRLRFDKHNVGAYLTPSDDREFLLRPFHERLNVRETHSNLQGDISFQLLNARGIKLLSAKVLAYTNVMR